METLCARWAWPLGLFIVFALPQCKSSTGDDDDEAGASAEGATSGTGGGGTGSGGTNGGGAAAGRAASTAGASLGGAGTTNHGGAAGGAVAATGGTGGSTAGMTALGGSSPQGGATNANCATSVVVAYPQAAPLDQATFDAMFPTAVCNVMKPCCAIMGPTYDETGCKTFAAAYYDKATLTYDPLAGARCLQSLALVSPVCDDDLAARGLPDACNLAYRGTLALGAECDRHADCAPDPRAPVECTYTNSVAMDICTVMIHGKVGDACDEGCEIKSDDNACYANDAPKKLGEWVTCHQEDGVRCTTDNVCEATVGLGCDCHLSDDYCDGHHHCGDDTSTCVPRGGQGATCTFNDDCLVEFYCSSEGQKTCQPRKHAQEACTSNDECLGLFCQHGSCNIENRDAVYSFDDAFCDGTGT
jgi:hypothetical protein